MLSQEDYAKMMLNGGRSPGWTGPAGTSGKG